MATRTLKEIKKEWHELTGLATDHPNGDQVWVAGMYYISSGMIPTPEEILEAKSLEEIQAKARKYKKARSLYGEAADIILGPVPQL